MPTPANAIHIGANDLPFANLNLDANGKVDSVADGPTTLEFYYAACEAQGLPRPNPLVE